MKSRSFKSILLFVLFLVIEWRLVVKTSHNEYIGKVEAGYKDSLVLCHFWNERKKNGEKRYAGVVIVCDIQCLHVAEYEVQNPKTLVAYKQRHRNRYDTECQGEPEEEVMCFW